MKKILLKSFSLFVAMMGIVLCSYVSASTASIDPTFDTKLPV
jgi:hypothetical protein